jgi:hypothetical protein
MKHDVLEAGSASILRQGQHIIWCNPSIELFLVTGLDIDGRMILKFLLNRMRGCGLNFCGSVQGLVMGSCEHSMNPWVP